MKFDFQEFYCVVQRQSDNLILYSDALIFEIFLRKNNVLV